MKLGKPKRYTWFRNASETSNISPSSTSTKQSVSPVIVTMANGSSQQQSNLVTNMSTWLLVPKGRNFRHILATVLCVILVYHVTLLAIPSNSMPASPNGALGENLNSNSLPAAAALTGCESCEDDSNDEQGVNNQISQPQNGVIFNKSDREFVGQSQVVGTSASQRSQRKSNQDEGSSFRSHLESSISKDNENKNFAPGADTSGSNYNEYYTDEISYTNGANKNSNNNYDMNSASLVHSDNQVATKTSPNSGDSGYANRAEIEHDDKSMRKSNDAINLKKQNTQSEKKEKNFKSKKLLNAQYQKRRKLLDSIFFSVKSTKRFHKSRLGPVINTWFNLAKDQTWIFTDDDDPELNHRTNGHVINTHCPSTHYRQALCCKMSAEFDTFIKSQKSWFCHFDDDNYVNVPALLDLLTKYDHTEDWYLGKPSLKIPIKIPHPDNKSEEISFWFATGGAGFCLSRALATKMSPVASGGKFTKLCDDIQLPDDVTIGYIAGHLLGSNLTVIPQFHSHYETMRFLDMKNPYPEITFSYVRYFDNSLNTLEIEGFPEDKDPTRFLSLHCLLFPNFSFCPKNRR